jgi:outer membrane protein
MKPDLKSEVPQDSVSLEPFIYTVNDVYISAIKNQPTIIKTQYDLESAKEGLYIAKSGYYPSISLNGRLGSGYSDARKTLVDVLPDGTEIIGVTASNEDVFAPKFQICLRDL